MHFMKPKSKLFAPIAAVAIASCFFGVSAISSASAEDRPEEQSLFLGEEPVFYTPDEASQMFLDLVAADPELQSLDASVAAEGAKAMFSPTDEEGYAYSYEVGYIESVAATASRCIQISNWVQDPGISADEVQQLSDQQFATYSKVPAIAELSNDEEHLPIMNKLASTYGVSPVQAEAQYACGVFGLGGGVS